MKMSSKRAMNKAVMTRRSSEPSKIVEKFEEYRQPGPRPNFGKRPLSEVAWVKVCTRHTKSSQKQQAKLNAVDKTAAEAAVNVQLRLQVSSVYCPGMLYSDVLIGNLPDSRRCEGVRAEKPKAVPAASVVKSKEKGDAKGEKFPSLEKVKKTVAPVKAVASAGGGDVKEAVRTEPDEPNKNEMTCGGCVKNNKKQSDNQSTWITMQRRQRKGKATNKDRCQNNKYV